MSKFSLKNISMNLAELTEAAEKDSTEKKDYKDERFWKPSFDDSGNSYSVIRFLPPPAGEKLPWAKYYNFFFKGPDTNDWYVQNSLASIGKEDPVLQYNSEQWAKAELLNDKDEEKKAKDEVRGRKQRLNYIYNIYVIKDSNAPENEGKVFLYRAGKTVYDIIKDAMDPEFEDQEGVPVFDFLEGADLKLRLYTKAGFPKYDKASFDAPSEFLDGDEDAIKEVYDQLYSLEDFTSPDKFKSYDELKALLHRVLALDVDGEPALSSNTSLEDSDDEPEPQPKKSAKKGKSTVDKSSKVEDTTEDEQDDEDADEDDPMAYFKDMAEE